MKIVFLYTLSREAFDFLRASLPHDIKIIAKIHGEEPLESQPNQLPEIINEAKDAEILMGPYITEEIMKQAHPKFGGKLKLLFIPWTGIDRINFDLLQKYPIKVANSHGNARTVAEHAIALLLSASKQLVHHDRLLREGDWSSRFRDRPSIILQGKIIGLLGFGAIGTECAKLLQGFDVEIIALRDNAKKSSEEQKKMVQRIFSKNELPEFLGKADIIINSLPLTDATTSFLGEKEFGQMKNGVIIINVGRGPTINELAFYNALKKRKVFAGGLDVHWKPPPRSTEINTKAFPWDYPIQEFDQIILSPHRAADVMGGYEIIHWKDVIDNIMRIYEGKEPLNLVNIEKGY